MSYLKGWKKCLFTQKQKGSLRIKTVLKPNVFQSEDLSSYATYWFLEYFDNLVEYLPKKNNFNNFNLNFEMWVSFELTLNFKFWNKI